MCQTKGRQLADTSQIGVIMNRITIRLPDQQVILLQKLVDTGEFPSVSEAVRYAVRGFLSQRGEKLMRESDQVSTFDVRL
jgi:Arc/MetJ-type ribon-helix-helix transcriptional regulator